MNKKQTTVLWLIGILCIFVFFMAFPRNFQGEEHDYAFNKMCAYATNLLMTVPAILIIGGLLIYLLKDKPKFDRETLPKVLVVDDEGSVLRILELLLEKMGYRALTALRAEAIMPILEKESVVFILLDIRLPGRSGLDILKEIKQRYPDLPVIMLTSLGYDDEAVAEARSLGAAGYVKKTASFRALKQTIGNVLLNVP